MKRKFSVTIFNEEEIKLITHFFPPVEMLAGTCVCYEGHIPQIAVLLTRGEIVIKKRKTVVCELEKNEAYGLYHLVTKNVLSYTATLKSNAKVCIISRTQALEIMSSTLHPLHQVFTHVLELLNNSNKVS